VAPDGSAIALAGYLLDRELLNADMAKVASRVYTVQLRKGAEPRSVGRGQFACWNLPT
jgi:hypothetical protein